MNVTLSLNSSTTTVDFFFPLERFRGNFPTAHMFSFPSCIICEEAER